MAAYLIMKLLFVLLFSLYFQGIVGFDYYLLGLQWPRSLCSIEYNICNRPDLDYFTIHGLLPQVNSFGPVTCAGKRPFAPFDLSQVTSDSELNQCMKKNWPGLLSSDTNLWENVWKEQGTCTGLSQHEYFLKTCDLTNRVNGLLPILQRLNLYGIYTHRSYRIEDYKIAVQNAWNLTPRIICIQTLEGRVQLLEIQFCVNKAGNQFMNCTWPAGLGGCGTGLIFFPN